MVAFRPLAQTGVYLKRIRSLNLKVPQKLLGLAPKGLETKHFSRVPRGTGAMAQGPHTKNHGLECPHLHHITVCKTPELLRKS